MNRKMLIVGGVSLGLAAVLAAGGAYALTTNRSDVTQPEPTPEHTVKYHVVGTSMAPTIKDGDWLWVDTKPGTVQRGQIIILKLPSDTTKLYCRRVVAVGGDRVVMKYYSNVKITTIYAASGQNGTVFPAGVTPIGNAYGEYDTTVPAGQYYTVGDNTVPGGSYDSDEWGALPVADVVGVVSRRLSPNPRTF